MRVGRRRGFAAGWRADEKSDLEEEGLHDLRERLGFVIDGGGDGLQSYRAPAVLADDRLEKARIELVEPFRVDAFAAEGIDGRGSRHHAGALDLDIVAHPTQEPIRDARRPPGSLRDGRGAVRLDGGAQDGSRAR